jgi:hypothetical protein
VVVSFFTGAPKTTGVYGADDVQEILNPRTLHCFTAFYHVLPCVPLCRVDDCMTSKIKLVKPVTNRTKLDLIVRWVYKVFSGVEK